MARQRPARRRPRAARAGRRGRPLRGARRRADLRAPRGAEPPLLARARARRPERRRPRRGPGWPPARARSRLGPCPRKPTGSPSTTSSSASASTGSTARRTSCSRELRARVPGALDRADHRVPRGGRLLVGHERRGRPRGQPRLGDLLLRARRHHRADRRDHPARAHRRRCSSGWTRRSTTASRRCSSAASRRSGSPSTRTRSARSPTRVLDGLDGPRDVRPRHRRRPAGRLARDRELHGHPAGGRRDLGAPDEHDARRRRPRPQPRGRRGRHAARRARDLRALRRADRRAPRAPDRRPHERARARRGRRRSGSRSTRSSWASSCSWPPATTAPRRPTAAACAR